MNSQNSFAILFLLLALSACGSTVSTPASAPQPMSPAEPRVGTPAPAGPVSVRHVKSTEPYEGGRFHLFLFSPAGDRPMDQRIALARNTIAADPDCKWIEVPQSVIESETAKQGTAYGDSLLVAPLRCS